MLEPYKGQIFRPSESGRFFLDGFNKSISTVVIMDRNDMSSLCTEKWREIIADESVLIESKYQDLFPEVLQSPIVFISNSPPPNSEYQNSKVNNNLFE